jgi:hypothetical protein
MTSSNTLLSEWTPITHNETPIPTYLAEYELDKATGELIKKKKEEPRIKYKWEESDFD